MREYLETNACYKMFPFLEQDDEGWWPLKKQETSIAMTFSLKATRWVIR